MSPALDCLLELADYLYFKSLEILFSNIQESLDVLV